MRESLVNAEEELEAINQEEKRLSQEPSDFDCRVSTLIRSLQPFETLWNTTLEFMKMQAYWRESPLENLNAAEAETVSDDMRRTMVKLRGEFEEQSEPSKAGHQILQDLDEFHSKHLPLLHLLCNPGLRERHWDAMSHAVGFELPQSNYHPK